MQTEQEYIHRYNSKLAECSECESHRMSAYCFDAVVSLAYAIKNSLQGKSLNKGLISHVV